MAYDPIAAQALQENRSALGYATRLACSMWGKHYREDAPNWRPSDHLMGVLSQIDNMLTGLARKPAAATQPQGKKEGGK